LSSSENTHIAEDEYKNKYLLSTYKNKFRDLENVLFTEIKTMLIRDGINYKVQESIERLMYSYLEKIASDKDSFMAFVFRWF
jgi:hypothetical protein